MDAQKVLRIIKIINIIVVVCFAPVGLFVFIYAIAGITRADYGDKMVILAVGYLLSSVAGFLAFKKPFWLIVSICGWLIVWWGQVLYVDEGQQRNDEKELCLVLRHNPDCTEDADGTMRCSRDFYPNICQGILK